MSPARIRTRRTQKGEPRYLVVYRMGGRGYPELTAGTFNTLKDARARRDFITSEIASGRDPRRALATITRDQAPRRTFQQVGDAMLASRRDWKPNTIRRVRQQLNRLNKTFGPRNPDDITVADIDRWITTELVDVKASTLLVARHTLRHVLDYADVRPNPARSPRLRWPKDDRETGNPPSAEHVTAMLQHIAPRFLELFVYIERTGAEISGALDLQWADIDYQASRVVRRRAKTGRILWAQVPEFLIDRWANTPADNRTGPVFRGITDQAMRSAMRRACERAGIPHYHPHDLRHRRGTIWHHDGVVARELAERMGHSSTRESLDTYSHVVPPGEVSEQVLADLVRTRCGQEGR